MATTLSPNGFTYTYGHNDNGAINKVVRSDGKKVDNGDPDFQAYLVAVATAASAPAAPVATIPVIATAQSSTQATAAAAVKAYIPDSSKSDHDRIAALEAVIVNLQKTGLL